MTKPADLSLVSLWFIGKGLPGETPGDITQAISETEFELIVPNLLKETKTYPLSYRSTLQKGIQRVREAYANFH